MRLSAIAVVALLAPLAAGPARAADIAKGETIFKRCMSCHTVTAGGPNRVGPNLHGVVGRPAASAEGYTYSKAMTGSGLTWTADALNTFLTNPKAAVPGTKMSFAGIKNDDQRADLIAYLQSQSE